MFNPILVSLSEGDKRMIFALVLVLLLILALMGYLSFLLVKLMKWQGKKVDTLIHDVVVTRVITDKKHLISYGRKKNWALFFKQAWIPLTVVVFGILIWIIGCTVLQDFSYNPFNTYNGFGSIFWTWKISGEYTDTQLIKFAKLVIDNTPHMTASGWSGYISAPCYIIGGTWYIVTVMALIGRTIKLHKRSSEIFEKSLEGFNQNEALKNQQSNEESLPR